jgi:hypothetical protein
MVGIGLTRFLAAAASLALLVPAAAMAQSGGISGGDSGGSGGSSGDNPNIPGTACYTNLPHPRIIEKNKACAPKTAPQKVSEVIQAGNAIRNIKYKFGGGHDWSWDWEKAKQGLDCSGTVSWALHAWGETGWLTYPQPSGWFMDWKQPGKGQWITTFAHGGHMYLRIGQPGEPKIRLDTSGTGGNGPSWTTQMRSSSGFTQRHPDGY